MNKLSCINIDISLCFLSPLNDTKTSENIANQEQVKKQPSPSPCSLRVHLLHLISIVSFKLGHTTALTSNFWNFSDPILEVNAEVRHFRQPWVLMRKIWQ